LLRFTTHRDEQGTGVVCAPLPQKGTPQRWASASQCTQKRKQAPHTSISKRRLTAEPNLVAPRRSGIRDDAGRFRPCFGVPRVESVDDARRIDHGLCGSRGLNQEETFQRRVKEARKISQFAWYDHEPTANSTSLRDGWPCVSACFCDPSSLAKGQEKPKTLSGNGGPSVEFLFATSNAGSLHVACSNTSRSYLMRGETFAILNSRRD
jgi:hypothetical protein